MLVSEVRGDVTVLQLRHGKVNALDVELLEELTNALTSLDDSVRAVVLTGNGSVFSAGVDLTRVVDGGAAYVDRLIPALSAAFVSVFRHRRPVVAAIDGSAIAGGCVLAAACDYRVMVDSTAAIGATELSVGVPLPCAALEVLRYVCGRAADAVVLGAGRYTARDAIGVGLVHEAVSANDVLPRAVEVAAARASLPAATYAYTKEQLRHDALATIAHRGPEIDRDVAQRWASAETLADIADQMARLRANR